MKQRIKPTQSHSKTRALDKHRRRQQRNASLFQFSSYLLLVLPLIALGQRLWLSQNYIAKMPPAANTKASTTAAKAAGSSTSIKSSTGLRAPTHPPTIAPTTGGTTSGTTSGTKVGKIPDNKTNADVEDKSVDAGEKADPSNA